MEVVQVKVDHIGVNNYIPCFQQKNILYNNNESIGNAYVQFNITYVFLWVQHLTLQIRKILIHFFSVDFE